MRYSVEVLAGGVMMAGGLHHRGDVVTGSENDLRPLVESGSAKWIVGPGTEPALQVDQTTWGWNVEQAMKRIARETVNATLRAWHTGETRHPRYKPEGRTGVKDAIEDRLGTLKLEREV